MTLSTTARRRLLVAGLVLAVGAWGLDTVAPSATAPLRSAAATALTPLESALTVHDDRMDRLTRERDGARREVTRLGDTRATLTQVQRLLGSAAADGRRVVPARVIAFTPPTTPTADQRVTIDVGRQDGVHPDQTVIATDGLVGRVVTATQCSSDVQLLTALTSVVGARVRRSGALGSLGSVAPPGLSARQPGDLTLTLLDGGSVQRGDLVRTLGSIDEMPYVADVDVGTVVSVDPDRGQPGRTAVVRPAVDMSSLDLVAVVLGETRSTPRAAVTGQRR